MVFKWLTASAADSAAMWKMKTDSVSHADICAAGSVFIAKSILGGLGLLFIASQTAHQVFAWEGRIHYTIFLVVLSTRISPSPLVCPPIQYRNLYKYGSF